MANTIKVIHKSIHIVDMGSGRFSIHTYVNGKLNSSGKIFDTQEEAETWAIQVAVEDCPAKDCPRYGKSWPVEKNKVNEGL